MKNLTVQKRITVNLTSEQWQLYTASMDCSIAAKELNHLLEESFNSGKPRDEVTFIMSRRMRELGSFGADDTEPRYVLEEVLDYLYGA